MWAPIVRSLMSAGHPTIKKQKAVLAALIAALHPAATVALIPLPHIDLALVSQAAEQDPHPTGLLIPKGSLKGNECRLNWTIQDSALHH